MLIDLLSIPTDRVLTVEDGQTLSLGDKTLEFVYAPWVHWPETRVTWLQQDRILITCDFFRVERCEDSMWLVAGLAAWWLLDDGETVIPRCISPNWRSWKSPG